MSFVLATEDGLVYRPFDRRCLGRAKQLTINNQVKVTLEGNYYISFWDLSQDNKSLTIEEVVELLKCKVRSITQGQFRSYGFKYETPKEIEFEKSGYLLRIGYCFDSYFRALSWSAIELNPKKPSNGHPNAHLPQAKELPHIKGLKKVEKIPTDVVIASQ